MKKKDILVFFVSNTIILPGPKSSLAIKSNNWHMQYHPPPPRYHQPIYMPIDLFFGYFFTPMHNDHNKIMLHASQSALWRTKEGPWNLLN